MFFIEPKRLVVSRHKIIVNNKLKQSIKILHLSDTHFSKPKKYIESFFDKLSKEEFHFVFITGDIIDCRAGIPFCISILKKLKAQYGIFAVLGNHDYYDYHFWDDLAHNFRGQTHPLRRNSTVSLLKALSDISIITLRNQTVSINAGENEFLIHGIDDSMTGHADLTKIKPESANNKINVLLTHTLDVFFGLTNHEIDFSFSGHSHGGQVCLPIIGPIITHTEAGRNYVSGVKKFMGATCSISRGIGASRSLWMRFLARPEAVLLELEPKK